MSQPISMPAVSLTGFPAIYLSYFSSSSIIHVPSPENFSHCWAYFFSQFFSHFVIFPQMFLPKSSNQLANSYCAIVKKKAQRAKELRESLNPYCSDSKNWLRFRNIFKYSQSQYPNTGQGLILDVFNIGIPILGTIIWALPDLEVVSAIFYQIFVFFQMITLRKLWKMFFISYQKLFSFSRHPYFYILVFPSFFPCQPLL